MMRSINLKNTMVMRSIIIHNVKQNMYRSKDKISPQLRSKQLQTQMMSIKANISDDNKPSVSSQNIKSVRMTNDYHADRLCAADRNLSDELFGEGVDIENRTKNYKHSVV